MFAAVSLASILYIVGLAWYAVCMQWDNGNFLAFNLRSVAQWLRRCITKPTVVGSILADATAFTDFVPFSKVLKLDCLFPTHGCAEVFILQWIDTARNLFILLSPQSLSKCEELDKNVN